MTPTFPATGTHYTISNANSGTEAQPDGCATANGTGIELSSASGTSCQEWTFTSLGNGRYTITNVASGTVLDSVDCGPPTAPSPISGPRWGTSARSGT